MSIASTVGWNPFALRTNKLASEVLARQLVQAFSDKLELPLAPLQADLNFKLKVDSTEHSKFSEEGGLDLTTRLDGPSFRKNISVVFPLISTTGVWMLGGKRPNFTPAAALPIARRDAENELGRRREALSVHFKSFELQAEDVEIHLPNGPVIETLNDISGPSGNPVHYTVNVSSSNATGVIAKAFVLKDNLLGDVGVTVTPQHPSFVSGAVVASLSDAKWVAGMGLQAVIAADAHATAAVHYHISTGAIGGGKGGDTTIDGTAQGTIPIKLEVAFKKTPLGNAIFLEPAIGCSRISIDAYSQAALANFGWIKIGRIGVRIKRSVGGGAQPPIILIDSLPQTLRLQPKDSGADASSTFHLAHPNVIVSWNPASVAVDETGIQVTAHPSISPSDAEADISTSSARATLHEAIAALVLPAARESDQQLALLVDQVEIGPNNEIVKFFDESVKVGVRVAQQTIDQIDKLRTKPLKTLGDAPGNIAREAEKGVHWLGDRTGIHLPW